MIEQVVQSVIAWYMENMNYWTVMLLMTVESSFIPFPSEIVIPPAAWKAAQGGLNVYGVIGSGTIGAILGAIFNYYLALFIGRKVIYKLADTRLSHALLVDRHTIEKSEKYFLKYGRSSTLVGRLVPVIRQFISLPAGFARMKLRDFILFTTIGAFGWNVILGILGYYLYSQKELLERYYKELTYLCLAGGIAFIAYLVYNGMKKTKTAQPVDK